MCPRRSDPVLALQAGSLQSHLLQRKWPGLTPAIFYFFFSLVIPAKAGIHNHQPMQLRRDSSTPTTSTGVMGPGLRRDDTHQLHASVLASTRNFSSWSVFSARFSSRPTNTLNITPPSTLRNAAKADDFPMNGRSTKAMPPQRS